MKKTIILILFILLYFQGHAQSKKTIAYTDSIIAPAVSLSELSWLTGYWKGAALGGMTEAIWSMPIGGAMVGTFRLIKNNEVRFYEIITITEENGTLIKRLKHFHKNLKGWEPKEKTIDFKFIKQSNNCVYFDKLTYEKISDDEMNIYVILGDGKGNNEEVKFPYYRVKI